MVVPAYLVPHGGWIDRWPVDASTLYLQRECVPFSGLALAVPVVCLCGVPALSPTVAVPCCGRGGAAVPGPTVLYSSLPLVAHTLISRVMGGVLSPPCPRPSSPGTPSP